MFVFDGPTTIYSHFDKSTGAHAEFSEVLKVSSFLDDSCGNDGCEI